MKRMQHVLVIALLAAAAPLAALAVHAQPPPDPPDAPRAQHEFGRRGHGPRADMERGGMMERLNLTSEQSRRIEDIRFNHQKKSIAMRADMESAHLDLGRLMRAENPDQRAIDGQIDRMAQLRAGLAKERVAGMFEMRSVLTPEQRKEWREMDHGMRGWGHGMRGMEGMEGPGGMRHGMHGESKFNDDDGREDGAETS